ncbi:MAG: response regulator [Bacteroidales bacterium]
MSFFQHINWKNKLILIVDDDQASLLLLEIIIAKTGAKIIVADCGKKALDLFLNTKGIDLILMDIKMEGMSGLEATRLIRKIDQNIPIIAQTACVIAGDKENCLRAGCSDYISKPIVAEELIKTIDKYIGVYANSYPLKNSFSEN